MFEMSSYAILPTAPVVSFSNHNSLFQFTDSAVTSVVVGRYLLFKSSSPCFDCEVVPVEKYCLKCLHMPYCQKHQ